MLAIFVVFYSWIFVFSLNDDEMFVLFGNFTKCQYYKGHPYDCARKWSWKKENICYIRWFWKKENICYIWWSWKKENFVFHIMVLKGRTLYVIWTCISRKMVILTVKQFTNCLIEIGMIIPFPNNTSMSKIIYICIWLITIFFCLHNCPLAVY